MGAENNQPRRLWPSENELVPFASATATLGRSTNGDFAEGPTPAGRLTAGEFTAERMLRPTSEEPTRGWRRSLYVLTGGLVRLGPSDAELRRRELVAAVKTPITGCRKVAFISRKGG